MPTDHTQPNLVTSIGPFGMIPLSVLEADISAGAFRMFAVLASWASGQTHEAFPSRESIAERCGCSERSVSRLIRELEDAGLCIVHQRGKQRTNVYDLSPAWTQQMYDPESDLPELSGHPLEEPSSDLPDLSPQPSSDLPPVGRSIRTDHLEPKSKEGGPEVPYQVEYIHRSVCKSLELRHGYVPAEMSLPKVAAWLRALKALLVKDKVPYEKVLLVAENVWYSEYHSTRFLDAKRVRPSFTAALSGVTAHLARTAPTGSAATVKAQELLDLANRTEAHQNGVNHGASAIEHRQAERIGAGPSGPQADR